MAGVPLLPLIDHNTKVDNEHRCKFIGDSQSDGCAKIATTTAAAVSVQQRLVQPANQVDDVETNRRLIA